MEEEEKISFVIKLITKRTQIQMTFSKEFCLDVVTTYSCSVSSC